MSRERIESLSLWRGPVSVAPLPGGITNRNYRVDDGSKAYFVRLCEERYHLGIDRRNELLCQHAAAACGVAPEVVHHEPGVLVSEFVAAPCLDAAQLQEEDALCGLAVLLRRLHGSWDELTGELLYFCPFQTVRTYAQTARRMGAVLPSGLDALIEDACRLSRQVRPFRPVLCHNDLLPANVLSGAERYWLVDWEYAGMGNALFDLAGLCANARLPAELEYFLVREYCGQPDRDAEREVCIYKAASLLREALWAWIQTEASDIEFDFVRYANENLAAYREARAKLNAPR
jgi:thiamine kinase-like enzyme